MNTTGVKYNENKIVVKIDRFNLFVAIFSLQMLFLMFHIDKLGDKIMFSAEKCLVNK